MSAFVTLPDDLVVYIFIKCTPKSLLACERVCKSWKSLIVSAETSIWKTKLERAIAENNSINREEGGSLDYLNKIGLAKEENWKTVYWIWQFWNHDSFCASASEKPILVPSVDIMDIKRAYRLGCAKSSLRVKLGRLVFGDLAYPFVDSDQQDVWFSSNGAPTYYLDLKNRNPSASLLSFSGAPSHSSISLIKQSRSDLILVQETFSTKLQSNVRAWNPAISKSTSPFDESVSAGQWIVPLQKNCKVLGFCRRKLLVLYSDRILVVYEFVDPSHSYFDRNKTSTTKSLWKSEVIESHEHLKIEDVAFNEVIIAILQHSTSNTTEKTVLLLDASNGTKLSSFPLGIPYEMGFENAGSKIALTRFHLIVYNCCNSVIFDIFNSFSSPCPMPPRLVNIVKLPYVGREVRIDFSDDGTMFILAPLVQTGEVVLFNIAKRTSSTYLLQNAYMGNQPKPGCWFVFEDDRVEWLPIALPESVLNH